MIAMRAPQASSATQAKPKTRKTSRSTDEQRDLVYDMIAGMPNGTLEAADVADARAQLGLEKLMTPGVFKSAIGHLAYPATELGERRRLTHTRDLHPMQTKSTAPSHVWRAIDGPAKS